MPTMARSVSRRSLKTEGTGSILSQSIWELGGRCGSARGFNLDYFAFIFPESFHQCPLPESFHQCPLPISDPKGTTAKPWGPPKQNYVYWDNGAVLDIKLFVFYFIFQICSKGDGELGALMESIWQEKPEVLGMEPLSRPYLLSKILNWIFRDRNRILIERHNINVITTTSGRKLKTFKHCSAVCDIRER